MQLTVTCANNELMTSETGTTFAKTLILIATLTAAKAASMAECAIKSIYFIY
jgi:hypothetical protein